MNKKALSLLIAVVMLLSVVPAVLPTPGVAATDYPHGDSAAGKISVEKVSPGTTVSPEEKYVRPEEIITPDLLEVVKELQKAKSSEDFWLPVRVVSQYPLENVRISGVKIMGHANIGGTNVYIVGIKISEDSLRSLQSLAKIKGVLEIAPMSDVRPMIETLRNAGDDTSLKAVFRYLKEHNSPGLSNVYPAMLHDPMMVNGKKVVPIKNVISRNNLAIPRVLPVLKGKMALARQMRKAYPIPEPQDIFAVHNLGSMDVWEKYNVTGNNINVAVIDSGVDFGNPDLQDAYAIETNPESPYYGWPIAFDSASMMDYLQFNMVFPQAIPLFGIIPWYTNTSLVTGVPVVVYAPYITGYTGDNFSLVFSGMSLANVPNETYRAILMANALYFLFNGTPSGKILLVDDDNGPDNNGTMWYDFDKYYVTALEKLGYNFTLYRVGVDGPRPNTTVLADYQAVIWFTGMNYEPFTDDELANVSTYLDNGGRLFLISTNFLDTNGFYIPTETNVLLNETNVPAPPDGNFTVYPVTINDTVDTFVVETSSVNESLDIDIYVVYNGSIVGRSFKIGPDERVELDNPAPGDYLIIVHSFDNPGNTTYNIDAYTVKYLPPIPLNFTKNYLHIDTRTYDLLNLGIPSVVGVDGVTFRASAINKGAVGLGMGNIGVPYYYLLPSTTDFLADPLIPDPNATAISLGFMAMPYIDGMGPLPVRLPLNTNLTLPFEGNVVHIGLHPDLALAVVNTPPDAEYLNLGFVLVVDSDGDGTSDKVYVDLTTDWGYFVDFNEDTGHTKDNPVIAWDLFRTDFDPDYGEFSVPGRDGYADLSGGMIYFIADGKTPIPYAEQVYERWNLGQHGISEEKLTPEDGSLVAFMLGTIFAGGLEHGTLCAAAIAARGRTVGPASFGIPGDFYPVVGNAIESKIIAEGDLYTPTSNWIDMMYFSTEGYDGQPGTGDEAQLTSNSYGRGLYYSFDRGFSFEDRFLEYLTKIRPETVHFFAAANEGPGYATDPSEGASPGAITIGAATEWGYRIAVGWNALDPHGDVVEFSSRGPNALGQVKPDVLTPGMFALGSTTLNMQAWRAEPIIGGKYANEVWAGTSLATPMAAGVGALVAEAFYRAHGRYPTTEEMREILMSAAENVYNDVFQQGSGYLNATKAVEIALEEGGVLASPTKWQAGSYEGSDHEAFPNILYPGESDSQEFKLTNYYNEDVEVKVEAGVLKKIGETEIPIENVNSTNWPLVRINDLIPNDTQMMKVTVYPNVPTLGVRMLVRLYGIGGLIQQGGVGAVVSFTVREPLERSPLLLLQVRQYGDATFNGTIKLEFYRITPWDWVKVTPGEFILGAKSSGTFKATLKVPENASYGLYEGAIYVDYGKDIVTLPVSVIVASPSPSFSFGGSDEASGLYDNSHLYSTQGSDYVKDARLYYFNVPTEDAEDGYILADVTWDGFAAVYPSLLQPKVDFWSMEYPDIFGPYGMVDSARGHRIRFGESVVMAKAVPGLNAMWVYTPFGLTPVIPFTGRVDLAKLSPNKWVEVKSQSNEQVFTVKVPEWAGDLTAEAFGFSEPIEYHNILAPETGESDYYFVNVTNSPILDVELRSDWDDIAGVDLDLYVYYNNNGTWVMVGSSTSFRADERVTINNPKAGQYKVEVYSWSNPAEGVATYDLSITTIDGTELTIKNIEKSGDIYMITAGYNLTEEHLASDRPLMGMIFIGTSKFPMMFQVPVKILPSAVDVRISGIETSGVAYVGETYNITAYITNDGLINVSNVRILLVKDDVPTDLQATIPVMSPKDVYKVSIEIPVVDTKLHEYRFVVDALDDLVPDNNRETIYVKGVDKENVQETYDIEESIGGKASITRFIDAGRIYYLTVNGDHGTIVTVVLKLPADTTSYYVSVKNADLLDVKKDTAKGGTLLHIRMRLHSPGEIRVDYITKSDIMRISTLNYVWYMLYWRYDQKFDELYKKALELGVDNETLQEALHYKELADKYYEEAEKYITPGRDNLAIAALPNIRKAYLNILKAYTILEAAIEEVEGSEG
ncbi:S8 family serine peptidase [Thermococcus sp.]|uniref:S8 family serine peptidase n=1 Tax=Thermococcus sp. TaxID=35749 RepID=UPI0026320B14|nr:S8 family serine peptidase [Thermococcus sp.]